jgi:hypothetical protein
MHLLHVRASIQLMGKCISHGVFIDGLNGSSVEGGGVGETDLENGLESWHLSLEHGASGVLPRSCAF